MPSASGISRKHVDDLLCVALEQFHPLFAKLPTELLDGISPYLEINDLLALLRVRRAVHDALKSSIDQAIYQRVHFNIRCTPTWNGTFQIDEPLPTLDLLLRSLLRRPSVALNIKHLRVDLETPACRTLYRRFFPLARPDFELAEQLLLGLVGNAVESWTGALRQCRLDVLLGLVISQLRGLESLGVPPTFHRTSSFLGVVIERCLSEFEQLRTIVFTDWQRVSRSHHSETSTDYFLPTLYCPNLENLTLTLPHGPCGHRDQFPEVQLTYPRKERPIAACLRSLTLHQSRISEVDLGDMLACCPSLREFIFDYRCINTYRLHIDALEIAPALSNVAASLEVLKIVVDYDSDHGYYPPDSGSKCLNGSLGDTLTKFSNLRCLHIPPVLLFGWTVEESMPLSALVPPNLRELHFRGCLEYMHGFQWFEAAVCEKITEFFDRCTPTLQRLKNSCGAKYDISENVEDLVAKARCHAAGLKHGVEVRLLNNNVLYVP